MNIGLFTDQYYPIVSGVVTSINMLYEGLENLGHTVYIFTSYNEKKISEEQKKVLAQKRVINLKGVPYPFKIIRDYRFSFSYRDSIKKIKAVSLDVIHVQSEYYIAKVAMKASKKLGIPIVHTFHTSWKDYIQCLFPVLDMHFHKQLLWLEKKWFTEPLSNASEIEILPTKKLLNDLDVYGINSKLTILPTGIEIERFARFNADFDKVQAIKDKYGITPEDFLFIYLGRTSKEKNIEVLITSFSKAFKGEKNIKFILVGGGPELDGLKNLAKESGVYDQMIFTDLVPYDDVPLYYHVADIFINASMSETQGLTYIEALASETLPLVQADEAIQDLIIDGKNGFVFNKSEELVEKMKYVYENRNNMRKLRERALITAKKYSKQQFALNILKVYRESIDSYFNNPENVKKITKKQR